MLKCFWFGTVKGWDLVLFPWRVRTLLFRLVKKETLYICFSLLRFCLPLNAFGSGRLKIECYSFVMFSFRFYSTSPDFIRTLPDHDPILTKPSTEPRVGQGWYYFLLLLRVGFVSILLYIYGHRVRFE